MLNDDDFHIRIKEERERLQYKQDEFATIAGVKKNTQSRYETIAGGKPDIDYLSKIQKIGADTFYIITGQRQQPFSQDEIDLISLFRQSSLENKLKAVQALKGELETTIKNQFNGKVGNTMESNHGNINIDMSKKKK